MTKIVRIAALAALLVPAGLAQQAQDWSHYVRIGGYGSPTAANADRTVKGAADTNVFGIEVDNDITGRYDSWLDPTEKLEGIRAAAKKIHEAGNYAFVYIAGTECITNNADQKAHTMLKDHPDWIQRNIKGEPAVFGGGVAFWVRKGDEDVWVSPLATEWLKIYMEHVRKIAATGIDGIYIDIPYWMTHFDNWTDTWASFDDYTVAAFKAKTGLNAKTDLKLGDFRDANFRKWVDFRIEVISNFLRQIDTAAKSVNPKIKIIPEIYPGIEESAVVVGPDVYELYQFVDTVAHEYSVGGRSATRSPLAWFQNQVGLYSFRAFAAPKPTWMLTYSWNGEKAFPPAEPMKNLAMAQLMAGVNTWDTRAQGMSGSNDLETRKVIFGWMKEHEKAFFLPREPLRPIGVYFSPKTRNYFAKEFIEAYRGVLIALMQSHLEFQIVTPKTLAAFRGDALILPDVRCLNKDELALLKKYGKTLVLTGETGKYDETGAELKANPLHQALGIKNPAQKLAGKKLLYFPNSPGAEYSAALAKEFNQQAEKGGSEAAPFDALRKTFLEEVVRVSGYKPAVEVQASPYLSTQIAQVGGAPRVYLANFKGLKSAQVAQQIPEKSVKVVFRTGRKGATIHVLPFLGEEQKIEGEWKNGRLSGVIPEIGKGAVVWAE
jgi:hypothetical protein